MANSYNVQALPNYVEQHKSELITKTVLSSKVFDYMTLMTGVKGPTALNLLTTDVVFGNGKACGWNEAGTATLSQRVLTPTAVKVNMAICDKVLLDKYANYLVKVEAGKTDRDLPFEKELVDSVIAGVKEKLEAGIFEDRAGAGVQFQDLHNMTIDGNVFTKHENIYLGAEDPDDPTPSVFDSIMDGLAQLPGNIINASDFVILASADIYNAFVRYMINANLYHYDPNTSYSDGVVVVPGTNIRMIRVDAVTATWALGTRISNIFYGTNLRDGDEVFDIWYSKDNREFRLAIEFIAGVQIAFPDETIVYVEG